MKCANDFEPCPMCGKRLTARDIIFADDEGYPIEEDRKRIEEDYNYAVDGIDHVYIACSCGFTFFSNTAYDFHNKSWFEEFKKEANRRA